MKKIYGNPYLPPYEYVPDGEPYVFDDRIYIYGSHDEANDPRFCVGDYVVWSAPCGDLSDWKYEGVSYERTADPHNRDGAHTLFAPDVVRGKDGNYYLYYCLNFLEEFGVAKSSRPQGPFTFYGHVHKKDKTLLDQHFPYDPSVLLDDDGRIFLYYGFSAHFTGGSFGIITPSSGCMVVELEDDMLTAKTEPQMCLPSDYNCQGTTFTEEHAYFEAPSMRRIGNLYYLVYSSQSQHELCYAVSTFPDRDFVYGGVIISNGDVGYRGNTKPVNYIGTNHGGLVNICGQWYIFYHRNTHGIATSRQGCAEKIYIDKETGQIAQVPITSYGLYGKPFDAAGEFQAYMACYLEKYDTQPKMKVGNDLKTTEPYYYEEKPNGGPYEHYIANITNRTVWGYNAFSLKNSQLIKLTLRGRAHGEITVSTDRNGNTPVTRFPIDLDTHAWINTNSKFTIKPGTYPLYFIFKGEGSLEFKSIELTDNQ